MRKKYKTIKKYKLERKRDMNLLEMFKQLSDEEKKEFILLLKKEINKINSDDNDLIIL